MTGTLQARRFTIRGRVQGVWFRDSSRRQAQSLGITGSAKNLADGDVEVLAFGDAAALDALARWLEKGPPLAKVETVLAVPAEWQETHGFTIA